jgi:hypothetical protein
MSKEIFPVWNKRTNECGLQISQRKFLVRLDPKLKGPELVPDITQGQVYFLSLKKAFGCNEFLIGADPNDLAPIDDLKNATNCSSALIAIRTDLSGDYPVEEFGVVCNESFFSHVISQTPYFKDVVDVSNSCLIYAVANNLLG